MLAMLPEGFPFSLSLNYVFTLIWPEVIGFGFGLSVFTTFFHNYVIKRELVHITRVHDSNSTSLFTVYTTDCCIVMMQMSQSEWQLNTRLREKAESNTTEKVCGTQ